MGAALLRLLQISDSSFPTGSFGHSQGLEYAILQGWVRERKSLYEWSKDCLIQTLFPLDGRSLWQAWGLGKANAVSELRALDLELVSFRPNFPQRQAGSQTGRSLLESALRSFGISTQGLWFNPLVSSQRMEGQFPIVWAWVCERLGIPPENALEAYFLGVFKGWAHVALRIIPLGQSESFRYLADISELLSQLLEPKKPEYWEAGLEGASPAWEIAQLGQENLPARYFRS